MKLKVQREWLALILVTFVARAATLQYSSIDHDESTYLIIAQQWLYGHLPWTDFLDIKPVGIYALFGAGLGIFGEQLWVPRILAILFISGTAFLILKILRLAELTPWQSRIGGLLFIICCSIHQWSWAANTEIFFVFFTALGIWIWMRYPSRLGFILVGLSFGFGFCIKYHVAFDLAALGLVHLLISKRGQLVSSIIDILCIGVGFLIPIVVWLASYLLAGEGAVLQEVLFDIPSRYRVEKSLLDSVNFIGEFYLVFLPVSILFFWSFWKSIKRLLRGHRDPLTLLFVIWPIAAWVAILLTGKLFFHYYIQQILPLVLVASIGFGQILPKWDKSVIGNRWVAWLVGALIFAAPIHQYLILYSKEDVGKSAAEIILRDLEDEDVIFANTDHIVYFLCKKPPPTRYVHSSIFHKPDLQKSFGMQPESELAKIASQAPRYCLVRGEKDDLTQKLLRSYQLVATFRGGVELWGI